MKKSKQILFLVILFILSVLHAELNAQDTLITDSRGTPVPKALINLISIELEDVPIMQALSEVADKGGFHLNYNENILPAGKRVTIHLKDVLVVDVLKKILEDVDVGFLVSKGGQIVLVKTLFIETGQPLKKLTISGYVRDAMTGEALIGTNVYIPKLLTGCTSNMYGFYSLTIPSGDYALKYSFIGYEPEEMSVHLDQNMRKNIELRETTIAGETVVVTADIEDKNITSTQMGTIQIAPKNLSTLPILFGEQDLFKTIQLLPGITQSREGDCGIHVRGGASDQNLVLLDEAPVYNAFHFLGFFSVFNSDAIKDVKLIKGSAPPRYGGRLSSVIDIQMNEGNLKRFTGNGGVGLIFSRLTMQGPLAKDKGSYIISGRRTYADLFMKLLGNEDVKQSRLFFYDFNLKTNYSMGDKDRIYLSGYFGRDGLGFSDIVDVYWGNKTATLRWNHLFSNKLFSNTSFIYSSFKYVTRVHPDDDDTSVDVISKIHDVTLKEDFQYFLDAKNTINFGLNYIHHSFLPGQVKTRGDEDFDVTIGKRKAHESAFYLSHEFQPLERLRLDYGLRYTLFSVEGQPDIFDFSEVDEPPVIDFHEKESKYYTGFEPRLMANFLMNSMSSVKLGFARNFQYIHLLSSSTSGTPLDVWQPSSTRVKPQRSDQVSFGYFRNMDDNRYEISVEAYYKDMQNLTDFKNGANVFLGTFFESELVFGRGWAYGVEFLLRKRLGRLTGWIGYTLSKTLRQFPDINGGEPFPARYDRPHDISLVGIYRINRRWTFSMNWVYFTGDAVTIPSGKYEMDGHVIDAYTERNAYRMQAYHRLDFSFTLHTKRGGSWNFSLYNAYGRRNAYALVFRQKGNRPDLTETVRLSLFSFFPSITCNFEF